ncbi:hypothetical protein A2U01_0046759 [Trifolium medium]|uniref:Uncharacterized protein n=1 Tax=Trifolium medium TaxID=97028 RepID=A0A392QMV6_9FABA|nr:hypothetical protein [Trifolium medium]
MSGTAYLSHSNKTILTAMEIEEISREPPEEDNELEATDATSGVGQRQIA